jgi:nitrite reductase/ring-hydroxylating ferredoxin subunit
MRRAPGLIDISRREFCAFACLGLALPACIDNDASAIKTGGLDGSDTTKPPDAGTVQQGDAGIAATCSGSFIDVGLPSSFVLNTPKYFSSNSFFVVRDAMGLYALTSRCSHQQVTLTIQSTKFHCNAHGADFKFDGSVIDGPTSKVLVHYAMCTMSSGHVGVQPSMTVSASTRLVA